MTKQDDGTDAGALLALAERCEREEPSRELDRAIGLAAMGWREDWHEGSRVLIVQGDWFADHPGGMYPSPTTSLDAAVTLVPEKTGWMIRDYRDGAASALVNAPPRAAMKQMAQVASTPALALCAAALRARAESPMKQPEESPQ